MTPKKDEYMRGYGDGFKEASQAALTDLKRRIETRLNDVLCEMKPEYDDSIHGFNEAWEIVSEAFSEAIAKAQS